MSWDPFLPLSRLTYGAYLNHIIVQVIVCFSFTSATYITDFYIVSCTARYDLQMIYFFSFSQNQLFIGIGCFTFGAAFVAALTVEFPFVNLEKILLGGGGKRRETPKAVPAIKDQNTMDKHPKELEVMDQKKIVVDEIQQDKVSSQ